MGMVNEDGLGVHPATAISKPPSPSLSANYPADTPTPRSEATCESQPVQVDVEVLGRQRPAVFKSLWAELGFCFSLLGSILMAEYFVSGFHIVLPPLSIALDIPKNSQTWPSSVFSLVTAACLLPLGRIGDMYGGHYIFNGGMAWFFVWSLVAGFSKNYTQLVVFRAMQGIGCAACLPAGIMLLGKFYRPGPRKNLVFGIYGAFAPIGFFFGILFGGAAGQYLNWRWYFWLGAIILGVLSLVSFLALPKDEPEKASVEVTMDWLGVFTIVPGLVLFVFALTDSSSAPNGWASPQIIATFVIGVLLLAAAVYTQGWVSKYPLLPSALFSPKHMKLLIFALWLSYGSFGVFLLYSSFYIELVMNQTPMTTAVWYIPMVLGGLIIGMSAGFTLHLLPGRILLIIAGTGLTMCSLLFAIMPAGVGFWPYVFPAMICCTIGIDITYTVTNVFITTNLPARYQGLGGAVINSVVFLGISFFLGIADIAVGEHSHEGLRESYKVGFWVAVGLSGVALCIFPFLDIGNAASDLTVEEKAQLAEELRQQELASQARGTAGHEPVGSVPTVAGTTKPE